MEHLQRLFEQGISEGLHHSAQVSVIRDGREIFSLAVGDVAATTPMLWMSAVKPLTAVALLQQVEQGRCTLDQPVADVLPDFAAHGKETITFEHILTHTGGIRGADALSRSLPFAEAVQAICDSRPEPRWVPGEKAGYHLSGSWMILAACVETLSGTDYVTYLQEHLLDSLSMIGTRIQLRPGGEGDADARVWDSSGGEAKLHPVVNDVAFKQSLLPGGNGWGPASDLARFYDALLNTPERMGLSLALRDHMISRVRSGMMDATFRAPMDWGLGVILNNWAKGGADIPYGFGPLASADTFGHGGSQCSVGFGDPELGIGAAILFDGMPGEPKHQARIQAACAALYAEFIGV